jgi:hypothetical protein
MLRTTNYTTKKTNETLLFAYAMVDKVYTDKNTVIAVFGIYPSKEDASRYRSVETKMVKFEWDRKSNVYEEAYNLAKKEGGIFAGWMDDLV